MSILLATDDNDDLLLSQFASRYDKGVVNDRVCAIMDPPSAAAPLSLRHLALHQNNALFRGAHLTFN